MKRASLATLGLLIAGVLPAAAQVAIPEQPDASSWYQAAMAKRKAGMLTEKQLLALKPGPIPGSLATDLTKFDWLLVGSYSYPEKKLGISYREAQPSQLDLARYLPDGGELRFMYSAKIADREHGEILHLNFQMPPPIKTGVKVVRGETYLQTVAYGSPELHRVVSYRNGVLVVDISYDGLPRSRQVKFRDLRVAIPRGFNWSPAAAAAP